MAMSREDDEILRAMLERQAAQEKLNQAASAAPPQYGKEASQDLQAGLVGLDAQAKAQRDNYLREQLAARVQDADLGMIGVGGAAAARFGKQDPAHFVKQMNTTENQDLAKARNADFQGWLKGKEGRMETVADAGIKAGQTDATTYNARLDALQAALQTASGSEKAAIQAQFNQLKESNDVRHDMAMEARPVGGTNFIERQNNSYENTFNDRLAEASIPGMGIRPRIQVGTDGRPHLAVAKAGAKLTREGATNFTQFANTAQQLIGLVSQNRFKSLAPTEERQIRETLQTMLGMKAKGPEMFGLGVLTGIDWQLVEGAIGKTGLNWDILTKNNGLARLNTMLNAMKRDFKTNAMNAGYELDDGKPQGLGSYDRGQEGAPAAAPQGGGDMDAQKRARLEELRKKKKEGTLK